MPRFLRFVVISSLMLFILYLFWPSPDEVVSASASNLGQTTGTIVGQDTDLGRGSKSDDAASVARLSTETQVSFKQDSLRAKLASEFPYDVLSVFPGFIWQTWRTTPSDADFDFRAPEATWTAKHPGYIHEVITDDIAERLIRHLFINVPEVLEAYDTLPLPILKADFFRYLILLARGGVYSDIDTEALRPAWEWVPDELFREKYGLVVGIEADPDRPDWAQWYSRRVQLCQWTMRSKPGHPVLIEAVAMLTEKTLAMKRNNTIQSLGVMHTIEWTGPGMWTDAVFRYFNLQQQEEDQIAGDAWSWRNFTGITEAMKVRDVIVLPITGFSPGQGHMGSEDYTDPHAMVKHDFEGSWKPKEERMKEDKP